MIDQVKKIGFFLNFIKDFDCKTLNLLLVFLQMERILYNNK